MKYMFTSKLFILVRLFLISLLCNSCQDYRKLTHIDKLPQTLKEISGIEYSSNSDVIWMINDSGNKNWIYVYNPNTKSIQRHIEITNSKNRDWEDLARGPNDQLYIGDFGNNLNTRKNLVIYSINNISDISTDKTSAIETSFYFEDQVKFPPKKKNLNYDVEAFIYLNTNFYLFTKNKSKPFNGISKVYKIPAKEGLHKAVLIGRYKTCNNASECAITSAAINYNTGTIALLSSTHVWLLRAYKNEDFFNGTIKKIKLGFSSQKESICFKNDSVLYITDERNKFKGGNLYQLEIEQ